MTFFQKNILHGFFSDSGSPVHGESNDTLCTSNRSKLVEKYKLEESCFEKKLKYFAFFLSISNFEIDLLFPNRFKNFFLRAPSAFCPDLIIFSEKAEQKNLGTEILQIG